MEKKCVYTAEMKHTDETVKRFMKVQYGVFQNKIILLQTVLSVAFIAAGIYLYQKKSLAILCLLIGCISISNLDMVPNYSSNRIISAFKNSFPLSEYSFYEDGFNDSKEAKIIPYSNIIKIVHDSSFCYLFVSKQYGYMIDKMSVSSDAGKKFNDFIETKTHLKWGKPFLLITFSLKGLLDMNRKPQNGERLRPHR